MRLYEFESKQVFASYGIPTPRGIIIREVGEIEKAGKKLGYPLVLKAQVLVGGRGKAGGVRIARSPDEARRIVGELLGSRIKGHRVSKILAEEALDVEREFYLAVTIDRAHGSPIVLASPAGGVEIEELARRHPEMIYKRLIDPFTGIKEYEARLVSKKLGLKGELLRRAAGIVLLLYRVFEDLDADLVEINPLALTGRGLVALDAKIVVDDNALYRHPDLGGLEKRLERGEITEYEAKAMEKGLAFVELDGDIGIIGNGAGLTMSTMDTVAFYGGRPADFLDVGGGAQSSKVEAAVELLLSHPRVRVVLINVFGGITRCDEVAEGIVKALEKAPSKPIVVRLIGTNEERGREILEKHGIEVFTSMEDAAKTAVELAGGR